MLINIASNRRITGVTHLTMPLMCSGLYTDAVTTVAALKEKANLTEREISNQSQTTTQAAKNDLPPF